MARSKQGASTALIALEHEAYSSLTTYKRDGSPVAVPIWHAVADDKIYMFTEAASFKVKRLRRDPRVELAACNWRGTVYGPSWKGTGRAVTEPALIAKAYRHLDRKYGWQKWLVDALSKIAGRYDARAILEISLTD
ncbi:MAG: PPOX class F420-dependent oxidoreductase [Deltaproteobacteria bacterium]|nr:PPOX class F420-dependent oxidoreductase [Deltaproteobacteria bacterium]